IDLGDDAAADVVVVNAFYEVDSISNFKIADDLLVLDYDDFLTQLGSFYALNDSDVWVEANTPAKTYTITGAADLTGADAGANILLVNVASIDSASALEAGLETGGVAQLSGDPDWD